MSYGYLAILEEEDEESIRTPYTLYPDDAIDIWCKVFTLAKTDLESEEFKQRAVEWFISNKVEIGSFLWVCFTLDFCPQAVRKKLSSKIYYQFH